MIKIISSEETIPLRHAVLRAGKPIESCFFDGDDLPSTTHFGLFIANELQGVVSVYVQSNPRFSEKTQYHLRGMAVTNHIQKSGIGTSLIRAVEQFVSEQKGEFLWFNARKNAVGFYEKNDFKKIDAPFEIKDIGTHYLMYKKLL